MSSDKISIINNFKVDIAAGLDSVSVNILKRKAKIVVDPLVFVYNLSIEKSIFLDKLKIVDVKLLFKSGDRTNTNNYRPIYILNSFSKILEKIIKAKLFSLFIRFFLENN